MTTADGASVERQPAQPQPPFPFLDSFSADLSGTYSQVRSGTASSTTVDATVTGDLQVKLHLELATTGGAGANSSTVTANKAQLSTPRRMPFSATVS